MRERELKLPMMPKKTIGNKSLPMRERELKREARQTVGRDAKSLPMRERELKLLDVTVRTDTKGRSPCGSVN